MSVQIVKNRLREVRDGLHKWLSYVADYPVVMAEASDPRPAEPHLAFKLFPSLVRVGSRDEHRPATDTTPYTIVSHRMITVTITAGGWPVGPYDDLEDKVEATHLLTAVQLALEAPTTQAMLQSLDLGIINEGEVIDISAEQETETEPRAVLDIIFGIRIDITDDPGCIEKAKMSGELSPTFDGSTRLVPEFTAPA